MSIESPTFLVALAGAYLVGSLPSAWLLVRWRRGEDIRQLYSGNVGASNARRVLGTWAFVVVFLIDAGKGALPIGTAGVLAEWPVDDTAWLGLAAVVGHCFPIWLRFRGGKGVATAAGVMLVLEPVSVLAGIFAWGIVVAVTRMSSLGSLMGLVAAGIAVVGWGTLETARVFGLISLIVLWRHRENIGRLRAGREHSL